MTVRSKRCYTVRRNGDRRPDECDPSRCQSVPGKTLWKTGRICGPDTLNVSCWRGRLPALESPRLRVCLMLCFRRPSSGNQCAVHVAPSRFLSLFGLPTVRPAHPLPTTCPPSLCLPDIPRFAQRTDNTHLVWSSKARILPEDDIFDRCFVLEASWANSSEQKRSNDRIRVDCQVIAVKGRWRKRFRRQREVPIR